MFKKYKKIIALFSILIVFSSILYFSKSFIKSLDSEKKFLILKYILPYKRIKQLDKLVASYDEKLQKQYKIIYDYSLDEEINFKKNLRDSSSDRIKNIKLSNDLILSKYSNLDGFHAGINNIQPGSGYIDFHDENLIILSSRGIIGYNKEIKGEKILFRQILNNIDDFIDKNQFSKYKWFSLKDLHIFNNNIFISYTEEIKSDCWNTSVISSKMNYEKIIFKKIFSSSSCIHSKNNVDKKFNAHQSGGRIISLNNKEIILSVGDYRNRQLTQDTKSINGKLIKININDSKYEILSKGLRNSQGMTFDKKNNFLLVTDHGPYGGDEINLVKLDQNEISNYGWPIASYGEHYGLRSKNEETYKKYPLLKSHKDNNFIEPLKYFVPSIAISEIIKIKDNSYVVSSLSGRSIYFFNLNESEEIINFSKVEVFERVRDMFFKNNKIFLFLEDTASIGIINLS